MIRQILACTLLACSVCTPATSETVQLDTASSNSQSALEEALVVGEQPGPGLWKISRGEHVLWILGTYSPLPKRMTWRYSAVEAHIAASQELLTPGTVRPDIDVGFFQAIALFPSMLKAGNIPDGATLQDILPADVYAKWQVLQRKYMPHNSVERMRPPFAAASLGNNAFIKSGLERDAGVPDTIKKLARKHKLKLVALPHQKVEIKIGGGRSILKKYSQSSIAGIECLTKKIDQLESDLDTLRERANAWATGDVGTLRRLHDRKLAPDCVSELINTPLSGGFEKGTAMRDAFQMFRKDLLEASQEQSRRWLEATESALARNRSTFAVMEIDSLLSPDGYLKRMRDRGYDVDEPDSH